MRSAAFASAALVLAVLGTTTDGHADPYFTGPNQVENDQGWTNYLRLANLDADPALELIVPSCSGFFSNPGAEPFRIYDNNGGSFAEMTAQSLGEVPQLAVRVVAVGDIDGDGDNDLFLPSAAGAADRLYINDGSGVFTDEASTRLPATANASRSAGARFGDVDGDGDLDLLVAQGYSAPDTPPARLLLNDGIGIFVDATANLPMTFVGTDPDDVDFADVDRDFDLDVLINAHSGPSALWRNDGNGMFTDISGNMPGPVGGPFHYGPSACDVDNDGDLDIVVDNIGASPRREQLLINDGTGQYTDGTAQLGANANADDNGVMCADVDDDGDFDLVIPSLDANERILINDNGSFSPESGGFPNRSDPTLWLDLGDVDGDGRIDAVTGQGEGSPEETQVYLGGGVMPVDARAPMVGPHESVDGVDTSGAFALRFAVRDRVVTDSGPRVRAFARVSVDGAEDEIDARFVGGDLFHVQIPSYRGMVTLALCAVDGRGNEGCSEDMAYEVSTGPGPGAGGGAAVGGMSGAGSAQGGNGTAEADDGFGVEDEGCSCGVPGSGSPNRHLWLAGLALVLARRRQRKF